MAKFKIELQDTFVQKLQRQARYISKDKPKAAQEFKKNIMDECKSLSENPLRCRKSIHYGDDNIRDLIVGRYIVIHKIEDNVIRIFALTKYENYTEQC